MSHSSARRQQGSTLVVALLTGLATATVMASYLSLIASRHKVTVRSQCWNAALPLLEAGLEEAMTHLHDDVGQPGANGWTPDTVGGQPVYTKTRNFSGGSYFHVTLYNANSNNPIIYSTGFVPSPLQTGSYISRTVKVTATNSSALFIKAIACTGNVMLSSNAVVDGFDSSVGPYDKATNRLAIGAIATCSTASPAVSLIGSNGVYGTVTTGPGGTVSASGGSAVGDVAWNASHTGIEPGWTNNNMNAAFPSNAPPSGGPFLPPPVVSSGVSNVTILGTGTYQLSSFASSAATRPMIVTGNATLWVTGNFTISRGGYVYLAPGANLKLYVGGATSIAGTGAMNRTATASQLTYIGLPSNTSVAFSKNAVFNGTINAPQADVVLSGNASACGSIISKTYTGKDKTGFHYDRALAAGGAGGYGSTGGSGLVATGWTEL